MRFAKGYKGKQRGTKDHSWARIGFWFEKIQAEWDHLTPNQKTHYSVELMKLLMSKAKQLPTDPQDSKFNIDEAMQTLKQIESNSKTESKDVKDGKGV